MSVFDWIYHSVFDPGNVLATIIVGAVATELTRRTVWRNHIRPHLERTKEIHAIVTAKPAPKPRVRKKV